MSLLKFTISKCYNNTTVYKCYIFALTFDILFVLFVYILLMLNQHKNWSA